MGLACITVEADGVAAHGCYGTLAITVEAVKGLGLPTASQLRHYEMCQVVQCNRMR